MVKPLNIVKGAINGMLGANSLLAETRLAICHKCNKIVKNKLLGDQCGVCGCFLDWKTRVIDESCDLNKWS